MFVAIVLSQGGPKMGMAAFVCVWLTMWSLGVAAILVTVAHLWKSAFEEGSHKPAMLGQAVMLSLFALPFVGGEFLGLFFLTLTVFEMVGLVLIGTFIAHVVFHHLLKAPTRDGRSVLDVPGRSGRGSPQPG